MLCRRFGLLALALVLLPGCDPGFSYRPQSWESQGEYEWILSFDELEMTTGSVWGLIGDEDLESAFGVNNGTGEVVVLERAELLTHKGTYLAELPGNGDKQWCTVNPGSSRQLSLYWDLKKSTLDVLGEQPSIILHFRLGGKLRRIEVTYSRAK